MNEPLSKSFVLITNDEDPEIDTLGIIIAAIKDSGADGATIARMFTYLMARYSSMEQPK